jgi:hypothetical protein
MAAALRACGHWHQIDRNLSYENRVNRILVHPAGRWPPAHALAVLT